MGRMIMLRMLGEIRLTAESGEDLSALLRQPKRLALLAYLASPAPGVWHRRDMLLALFWPELDSARARTSLRNGLYVIRQTLGDDIVVNRGDEEICVNAGLVRTDVAMVLEALRLGETREALSAYGGELLPGLFPPDSAGFQRWLEGERTRLRTAISVSAVGAFTSLEANGQYHEALEIARRVVEIQPDDETLVRRLMSLHERVGDRAGALTAYESYRTRLAVDFDAEPSGETLELVNKLRAANPVQARRAVAKVVPAQGSAELLPATASAELLPEQKKKRPSVLLALVAATVLAVILFFKLQQDTLPILGTTAPLTFDEGLQVEPAISPSGRLVAYAKGNPGNLRIFVQKIGSTSAWPLNRGSAEVELMPRWSPENDEVLFLSRNNAYASPSVGGTPRLIARGSEADGMVRSASWSPDGDSVLIVRNDSLIAQVAEGSATRLIARAKQLHSCVWSPNGELIACVSGNVIALTPGPLFGNEAPSSIIVISAKTGAATDLTGNRFEHKSPAWSADGKYLWFLSNRDGVSGEAYAQRISANGTGRGALRRVGLKAEWISLSADRLTYSLPARKANVWSIGIPVHGATGFDRAKQLSFGNQIIEMLSMSRDGKWLFFDSNIRGNSDIYRMSLSGTSAERLTEDPRAEYAPDPSPQGDEIAWQKFLNGERHLFTKNLNSDSAIEILPVKGDQGVPRWSPNGEAIAGWSHDNERGGVFVITRDKQRNWKGRTWRLNFGQLPIWSADGSSIAFVLENGIVQSIPADSGSIQTLYAPRPGTEDPLAIFLQWNRKTNAIWFMGTRPDGSAGIWSLPAKGGRPELRTQLNLPAGKAAGASFTSDGSHFYVTVQERSANVRWAELVRQ